MASAEARLKEARIAVTPQRELLLSLLMRKDYHPTADELEREANLHDRISTTTVYLSLRLFVMAGIAHTFSDRAGKVRYGAYPKPHTHTLCVVCGTISDVEVALPPLALPRGWVSADAPPLAVAYAYCPTCRALKPQG